MNPVPLVGLRWAIKRSFLDYIARVPGGTGSLSEGAVATELKEVVFPPEAVPTHVPGQAGTTLAFRGTITFRAYSGALYVRIGNPRVAIRLGHGELTVLDPFQPEGNARLRLATFDIKNHLIDAGFEHWAASNVRLAQEGRELFNEVYPESELLEPFTIIIPCIG